DVRVRPVRGEDDLYCAFLFSELEQTCSDVCQVSDAALRLACVCRDQHVRLRCWIVVRELIEPRHAQARRHVVRVDLENLLVERSRLTPATRGLGLLRTFP